MADIVDLRVDSFGSIGVLKSCTPMAIKAWYRYGCDYFIWADPIPCSGYVLYILRTLSLRNLISRTAGRNGNYDAKGSDEASSDEPKSGEC